MVLSSSTWGLEGMEAAVDERLAGTSSELGLEADTLDETRPLRTRWEEDKREASQYKADDSEKLALVSRQRQSSVDLTELLDGKKMTSMRSNELTTSFPSL